MFNKFYFNLLQTAIFIITANNHKKKKPTSKIQQSVCVFQDHIFQAPGFSTSGFGAKYLKEERGFC